VILGPVDGLCLFEKNVEVLRQAAVILGDGHHFSDDDHQGSCPLGVVRCLHDSMSPKLFLEPHTTLASVRKVVDGDPDTFLLVVLRSLHDSLDLPDGARRIAPTS